MLYKPSIEIADTAGADSLDVFFKAEYDGQVRRAYLILGSSATAHDVVADAMVQVIDRWDKINEPGPYLNRCVLNGCRDAAKRAKRESILFDQGEHDQRLSSSSEGLSADALALTDVLLQLPFKQRAAVVMRFYGSASERDIAACLGCRPGTVGSYIHRGLATLRKALEQ